MNTQNYLAIDLELNSNGEGNVTKIIQVGVAIGSNINNIQTYKWYVNPKEPLTPFITELTGITQEDIDTKAVPLSQVAAELGELIVQHNTFVNPVQWGFGDADELKAEFKENNVEFPYFGHRAIDVKTIYTFLQMAKENSVKGGLRSCMGRYKLTFKGEPHRADVDAYNTLVFYFALMHRQKNLEEIVRTIKYEV
jgi:inhibitor of KinA sporulation pathway (predicted exonuclease)